MKNLENDIVKTLGKRPVNLDKVLQKFSVQSFKKKAFIESPGKVSNTFQFIEEGIIRVYYIDDKANEITIQIGISGMWVYNLYSFITQTPSHYYIEAITPVTLYEIHKQDLESFYSSIPEMETFMRLKVERAFCSLQDRTLNQLSKSAEEHYLRFKENYGHIEQLVHQYIIASYLNISPEHLSKIKHRLAHS